MAASTRPRTPTNGRPPSPPSSSRSRARRRTVYIIIVTCWSVVIVQTSVFSPASLAPPAAAAAVWAASAPALSTGVIAEDWPIINATVPPRQISFESRCSGSATPVFCASGPSNTLSTSQSHHHCLLPSPAATNSLALAGTPHSAVPPSCCSQSLLSSRKALAVEPWPSHSPLEAPAAGRVCLPPRAAADTRCCSCQQQERTTLAPCAV